MIFILRRNAGMVFFKSKDYEDAVADLDICIRLDKNNKSAYSYMVGLNTYLFGKILLKIFI